MTRNFLPFLIIPALCTSAFAQTGFQAPAVFAKSDGEKFKAWILAATKTEIRYKTNLVSTSYVDAKIADFSTIYLINPPEFVVALDLYEAKKYKAAKAEFAAIKEAQKPSENLKGNYHTIAAFYEMECMRQLGDYTGLSAALQNFTKEQLTNENQLRQLDLYVMWDAVKSKSWDKLLTIATERDAENLPGDQKAQVAFCKGLALENLKQPMEAITAYNIAMTADTGASDMITQNAAIQIMQIYLADPEVQVAMEQKKADTENKNSNGYNRLKEAIALAKFYELALKADKDLPSDLTPLLDL